MDEMKKKADRPKPVRVILAVCAVLMGIAAYAWYQYNLPEQRLQRALQQAHALMEEQRYEEAAAAYAAAQEIVSGDTAALEGYIQALMQQAEVLSQEEDIPSRARACAVYEEVISICDEREGDVPAWSSQREEAAARLVLLREKNAASFEKVHCVTSTEDRSGTAVLADGSEIPYTYYYDLVQIEEDYYPYAETINGVLAQQMTSFFSYENNDPSSYIAGAGELAEGEYRDYVGEAGIYSDRGLLSIRMAEVRIHGQARSNYYCGKTFRLSDAAELTLADLTGMDTGTLRRLIRHRIWSWLKEEGYGSISKSDVEKYAEDTEPDAFQYCIREDGAVCLVIDQSVPFFSAEDEILEIPLETD